MVILLLLPVICFFLLLQAYHSAPAQPDYRGIRKSFIYASLTLGTWLVFVTEFLSYFKWITAGSLIAAWSVTLLILLAYSFRKKFSWTFFRQLFHRCSVLVREHPITLVIPLLLAVSFFISLIYPPNNYDSLTYHMGRVGHWIQNHSISHFQTHIIRQLIYPPFAEWVILHLDLLSGTDRIANAVQTFFFAGCILEVSLVAKELGGNKRQQLFSSLFASLVPMAIIQSNTTQNDLVVAYFVLSFVYCTIRLLKATDFFNIVFAGVALGLALLTKGTAFLFCCVFCVWYALLLLKKFREPLKNIIYLALRLSLVPLIAVTINYGHFYRNTFLTGSPLGNGSKTIANEEYDLKSVFFVGIRNFLNHMPVTSNTKKSLAEISDRFHVDINDPKYSYNDLGWMMEGFSYHEDYAQNFWHTMLIVAFGVVFLCRRRLYVEPLNLFSLFVFSLYAIAVLFCVLFKWQPWSNRLETSLFMLFCVMLGTVAAEMSKVIRLVAVLPLFVFAAYASTTSSRHPLLPYSESIFAKNYDAFIYPNGLDQCRNYIDTCSYQKFGIYIGGDTPDYPFFKMFEESPKGRRTVKHIFVENESQIYLDDFVPDVIISQQAGREDYKIGDVIYKRKYVFGPATAVIFERQP